MHVHGVSQGRPEREQGPQPVHEEQDHVHPETFRAEEAGKKQQRRRVANEKELRRGKTTSTDQEGMQLQLQLQLRQLERRRGERLGGKKSSSSAASNQKVS